MSTGYALHGSVAVITLDNPPVNSMNHAVRTVVVEGIDRAQADPAVNAIVLTGAGGMFSGGADIREFTTPQARAEPTLPTVIAIVEASDKPVIAAIGGSCMGGGLELALGCHFRVAVPHAQIALPEVKLGLLPGAGGTQRLPRAIGVEAALNMIVSGASVPCERFRGSALFDAIVEGDLLQGALAFAAGAAVRQRPLPRMRDIVIHCPNADALFQFARNTVGALARGFPAPLKCIDAVAAAVAMPFDEGLRYERELFIQLAQTSESRALRHAFFAERAAAKIADVAPGTMPRPIDTAAVIGAGTMGSGIAICLLDAGIPVGLVETTQEALGKGVATIRAHYDRALAKGRVSAGEVDRKMTMLKPTLAYGDLAGADLIIEAVFEDLAVKQQVFERLDAVAKPAAILASNTSTLDLNKIAAFTARPQNVVGMHFFSPANVMKLLEVVRGARTGSDVLVTVMNVAKRMRKTAVVSGVCDGFIGNRMIEQYLRQALFLLDEGASPAQVDRALEKFGMAMGPFRMSDLAGNDVGWYIRKRRYIEKPQLVYSRIADRLCELGRFGQKTGLGWYRYESGRRDALPDPAVDELIATYRTEFGTAPRKIADQEIVERCIYALVNEGARILEDGIASRASDIDVVYLTGYGFPLYRGGPMHYADTVGLFNVIRAMRRFGASGRGDPAFWQPAPLLTRLAAEGKTFNS